MEVSFDWSGKVLQRRIDFTAALVILHTAMTVSHDRVMGEWD